MNDKINSIKLTRTQSFKRLSALIVCVLFIAVTLLSAAFIITYINHEHDLNAPSGGCATCAQISAAENLLKSLSAAIITAALVSGSFSAIRPIPKPAVSPTGFYTLIRLKIRLNI